MQSFLAQFWSGSTRSRRGGSRKVPMDVRAIADETLAHATGRSHRTEPELPVTGGPAGNAQLSAWTGLLLLALFLAEMVTLLDVRGLVSWHVAIGVLLIPPALVKTASTGWRIVRYYAGSRPYRLAGPPPLLLRVLGPVVVVSTLAVLASGVALIVIGTRASQAGVFTVAGRPVDPLALHKATFVVWAAATGLHTLARLVPALQLTVLSRARTRSAVAGGRRRAATLVTAMVAAVAVTVVVMGAVDLSAWHARPHRFEHAQVTNGAR